MDNHRILRQPVIDDDTWTAVDLRAFHYHSNNKYPNKHFLIKSDSKHKQQQSQYLNHKYTECSFGKILIYF